MSAVVLPNGGIMDIFNSTFLYFFSQWAMCYFLKTQLEMFRKDFKWTE